MSTIRILANGQPAWEFQHHLPVLWPWLFDPAGITESRRLHATVFDAGARFADLAAIASNDAYIAEWLAPFEELRADGLPNHLDLPPDAVLRLDLAPLEHARPYRHEAAAEHWESFFAACPTGRQTAALAAWESAALNPLVPTGGTQQDALMLLARADEMALAPDDRAAAMVRLLFGHPASRAARALEFRWIERARRHPAALYSPRRPWWSRLRSAFSP